MNDSGLGGLIRTVRLRFGLYLAITAALVLLLGSLVALASDREESRTFSIHMVDETQLSLASGAAEGVGANPALAEEEIVVAGIARELAPATDTEIRVSSLGTSTDKVVVISIAGDEGSTSGVADQIVARYLEAREGSAAALVHASNQDLDLRIEATNDRLADIELQLANGANDASGAFVDALNTERTEALKNLADDKSERAGNDRYAEQSAAGVLLDRPVAADITGGLQNIAKSGIIALIVAALLAAVIVVMLGQLDPRVRSGRELASVGLADLGHLKARRNNDVDDRFLAASVRNSAGVDDIVVIALHHRQPAERVLASLKSGGYASTASTAAPLAGSADLLDAAAAGASIVLAIRSGRDRIDDLEDAIRTLTRIGVTPLGAVLVSGG